MTIAILDYGAGNVKSVANMLEFLKAPYIITNKKEEILAANKIILPGQGHFEQFMNSLEEKGLTPTIIEAINSGIPFLGICVGLQVLFEESEEAPNVKGLSIFKGKVKKYQQGKVPQIGWNKVIPKSNNSVLPEEYFYYVNSYYVEPEDKSIISAYSNNHIEFTASIEHKNIFGMQFHPEKSGKAGQEVFKKWLSL